MRKLEDVIGIIRDEVETIRKREGGDLPKTPYVVMEIIGRMKTLTEWEGKDKGKPVAFALREIIEAYVRGQKIHVLRPKTNIKNLYEDAESFGEEDFFSVNSDLDVDWEEPKSVQRFVNEKINAPSETLTRSARRQAKKNKKLRDRLAG